MLIYATLSTLAELHLHRELKVDPLIESNVPYYPLQKKVKSWGFRLERVCSDR